MSDFHLGYLVRQTNCSLSDNFHKAPYGLFRSLTVCLLGVWCFLWSSALDFRKSTTITLSNRSACPQLIPPTAFQVVVSRESSYLFGFRMFFSMSKIIFKPSKVSPFSLSLQTFNWLTHCPTLPPKIPMSQLKVEKRWINVFQPRSGFEIEPLIPLPTTITVTPPLPLRCAILSRIKIKEWYKINKW